MFRLIAKIRSTLSRGLFLLIQFAACLLIGG